MALPSASDRSIRALLVEDDPDDSLMLMHLMAQSDWPSFRFILECAETLTGGLEVLARGGTEVVLLDLMLPDCQGLETVRRVRERFPDVPVVVLTGMRDEALGLEAVLRGAQDYQVKGSIEAHALKRTISYAVERHRTLARLRGLIDKSADAMVVIDAAGVVRYMNAAGAALFAGVGPLLGRPFPFPTAGEAARELRIPSPAGERAAEMRLSAIDWEDKPAALASVRDITELRRVEQLKAEVKEQRRMDKLKDELMSAVSHEMRSPLTIIKAAAINLKDGLTGPMSEEQMTMVHLQYKNILRLQKILDHILDLSRLESGRVAAAPRRLNPLQLIREAVNGYQLLAAEKGLRIELEIPRELPAVTADPDLFAQVLGNLLDNAVRFTKSRVVVHTEAMRRVRAAVPVPAEPGAAPERRCLQVSVADDGRGIPKERLGEVFNKFVQLDRGDGGEGYKGTGLGLAICREIMDRLGGRIWVESEAGKGARFFFTLPLAEPGGAS